MKKIAVILAAMIMACAISCGKETEAAKPKASKPYKFKQYDVIRGDMINGGIGYILKSDDKSFLAIRKTRKRYTDKVTFTAKMKSSQQAGPRNGFIVIGSGDGQRIMAGILIGTNRLSLSGNGVEKKEIHAKFAKNKVFDIRVKIDIKKKEIVLIVDNITVKSKITGNFNQIKRVGYAGNKTKTEFTEITEI